MTNVNQDGFSPRHSEGTLHKSICQTTNIHPSLNWESLAPALPCLVNQSICSRPSSLYNIPHLTQQPSVAASPPSLGSRFALSVRLATTMSNQSSPDDPECSSSSVWQIFVLLRLQVRSSDTFYLNIIQTKSQALQLSHNEFFQPDVYYPVALNMKPGGIKKSQSKNLLFLFLLRLSFYRFPFCPLLSFLLASTFKLI